MKGFDLDAWLSQWPDRMKVRNEAFIEQFLKDINGLEAMGFDKRETMDAVGNRLYLLTWAANPGWLEKLDKLPKPLKWADGISYKEKKLPVVKTVVYANTLFIAYKSGIPVGSRSSEKPVLVVHNFQQRSLSELRERLPNGIYIDRILTQIAREYGLRPTNNYVHFLRDLNKKRE